MSFPSQVPGAPHLLLGLRDRVISLISFEVSLCQAKPLWCLPLFCSGCCHRPLPPLPHQCPSPRGLHTHLELRCHLSRGVMHTSHCRAAPLRGQVSLQTCCGTTFRLESLRNSWDRPGAGPKKQPVSCLSILTQGSCQPRRKICCASATWRGKNRKDGR